MFEESINRKTKLVFEKIAKTRLAKDFYLAGGTALAVLLGHRESIDLDWFSPINFANPKVKKILSEIGNFEIIDEAENTVNGILDGVKVSFFNYPYKLLFPLVDFWKIKLADERDIAAMKIDTVSSRGSKKDFIDIYFLLEKYSLLELIDIFEKKFKGIKYNKLHILKSLSYFDDAESEPMPKMLKSVEWEAIKEKIEKETKNYLEM